MKICFFYWGLQLGGVEHMITNLSRELVRRGHDVTLVLTTSPRSDDYKLHPDVKVVWLKTPSTWKTLMAFRKIIQRERFDIIYSAMCTFNVTALLARALASVKTPVVISERTNPFYEYAHAQTWRYRSAFKLQRIVYPLADRIIAVSHDLGDELAKFARLRREKIQVIYNPAFDEKSGSVNDAKPVHPWLVAGGPPVIITAGRLVVQKDISTFLKAIALVARQREVRAVVLGEGPLRAELEQEIKDLGLSDRVALPGFVPDVMPWLRSSGFFVLSSRWEGFGDILVQALAAGCSITSTNCPNGPREILQNGLNGNLVPVQDPRMLADGIISMLDKPFDKAAQLHRAADFTLTRAVDQYMALFNELAQPQTAASVR